MATSIEVVGVYAVPEAEQPVSLIELWVHDFRGKLQFAEFSQRLAKLEPADEQVAYLEHKLNFDGTAGEPLYWEPLTVEGEARIAFFMHYLDTSEVLATPLGPVLLPPETARPQRLAFIEYREP